MTTAALEPLKPVRWVASSRADLKRLPKPVQRKFGYALQFAQRGEKHDAAKVMRGFASAGVLEVVEQFDRNAYRAVYTVRFAGTVYVLHVFQKKSTRGIRTPTLDLELIRGRLRLAQAHYEQRKESTR